MTMDIDRLADAAKAAGFAMATPDDAPQPSAEPKQIVSEKQRASYAQWTTELFAQRSAAAGHGRHSAVKDWLVYFSGRATA
jgi:hypothetical protein